MRIWILRALGQLKTVTRLALYVADRDPQGLRGSGCRLQPQKRPMPVLGNLCATESDSFALYRELSVFQTFAMHQKHRIGETGPPTRWINLFNLGLFDPGLRNPGHFGW